jgi:anti-sigma-K factor RskA
MSTSCFHPSGDAIVAFLLDELDADVHARIARHLEACEACLREHAAGAETLAALALAAPPQAPTAQLRRRVLAVAGEAPGAAAPARRHRLRRPGLRHVVPLGLAAAVAAAALVVVRPDSGAGRVATFSHAAGELRVDGGTARLTSFTLPAAPPGRSYELWVLRPGHAPQPAGLIAVGGHPAIDGVRPGDQVAVTLEPARGSAAPTSAPVAVAAIDD